MSRKNKRAERVLELARISAEIDREIVLSLGGNACMLWLTGGVRTGAHTNQEHNFRTGSSRKCKHRAERGW